jgi:holo-[acyl-carrier protein] synthase
MIYGIGTDICKIPRIEARWRGMATALRKRSWGRRSSKNIWPARPSTVRGMRFVATRFAAKEAFSKAIGLGMRMPMTWPAAQMLNHPSGKPMIVCSGVLQEFMEKNKLSAQVTVSDEEDYAVVRDRRRIVAK